MLNRAYVRRPTTAMPTPSKVKASFVNESAIVPSGRRLEYNATQCTKAEQQVTLVSFLTIHERVRCFLKHYEKYELS